LRPKCIRPGGPIQQPIMAMDGIAVVRTARIYFHAVYGRCPGRDCRGGTTEYRRQRTLGRGRRFLDRRGALRCLDPPVGGRRDLPANGAAPAGWRRRGRGGRIRRKPDCSSKNHASVATNAVLAPASAASAGAGRSTCGPVRGAARSVRRARAASAVAKQGSGASPWAAGRSSAKPTAPSNRANPVTRSNRINAPQTSAAATATSAVAAGQTA
jgi:hypothetical protein